MKSVSTSVLVSVVLSMVLAVYALVDDLDFCFFALEVIAIGMVLYPRIKRLGFMYSDTMVWASVASQLLIISTILLDSLNLDFMQNEFWLITMSTGLIQTFQSLQAFFIGLMLVLVVYKSGFRITVRWMMLAAMFVSLSYGVICMFGYTLGMYFAGHEVFNALGGYAADELNANMMSCVFVGVFVSAITAVVASRCSRGKTMDDFVSEEGFDVQ